jgi:hypothetical protein
MFGLSIVMSPCAVQESNTALGAVRTTNIKLFTVNMTVVEDILPPVELVFARHVFDLLAIQTIMMTLQGRMMANGPADARIESTIVHAFQKASNGYCNAKSHIKP